MTKVDALMERTLAGRTGMGGLIAGDSPTGKSPTALPPCQETYAKDSNTICQRNMLGFNSFHFYKNT